jgi:hypothetical protein
VIDEKVGSKAEKAAANVDSVDARSEDGFKTYAPLLAEMLKADPSAS